MGVTANRAYPYPDPADAPNGPYAVQQLANAVDADVNAVVRTTAAKAKVMAGTGSVGIVTSGGSTTVVVTFPVGTFTTTPVVVATAGSSRLVAAIEAVSSTQVTVGFFNNTASSSSANTFHWVAVGA